MKNRKAAEQEVLAWVKDVDMSGKTLKYYQEQFSKMTDIQFEKWIEALEEGVDYVCIISENMGGRNITEENNLKVAKKRGVPIFERIWVRHPQTGHQYLTNIPYPLLYLPLKKQIESIENKQAIPKVSSKRRDEMTGQAMDAEMSMSLPETQILYAMGLESVISESLKYRGGDIRGGNEFDRRLIENGEVSVNDLLNTDTRVTSTDTLRVLLLGMHYDNNL